MRPHACDNRFPSTCDNLLMNDTLQRFLFERLSVRGEVVHLDATWREALSRHDYPPPVRTLLGEMMASCLLLSATLKLQGSIIMQIQGDGPVSLMVVEATAQRTLRGLAHSVAEVPEGNLQAKFGSGRLVITVDHGKEGTAQRYQGIVALEGKTLAAALDAYLERSEQLPTRLWLASNEQCAAGLLLQRLPGAGADEDAWDRVVTLGATITDNELLELPAAAIIQRLFHQEDVWLLDAEAVSFRCSCSRERVAGMLHNLGPDEVTDILRTEGEIEVTCEFCNKRYTFDAVDAQQLFAEGAQLGTHPTQH